MTDNTNLIAELRYVAQWPKYHLDKAKIVNDGADALEALQDEVEMWKATANAVVDFEKVELRAEVDKLTDLLSIVDGSVLQAAQRCMDRVKKLCDERAELQTRFTVLEGQLSQANGMVAAWKITHDAVLAVGAAPTKCSTEGTL